MRAARKDWACQECGLRMAAPAAHKAALGPTGCVRCGSSDIDLAPVGKRCVTPAVRRVRAGGAR